MNAQDIFAKLSAAEAVVNDLLPALDPAVVPEAALVEGAANGLLSAIKTSKQATWPQEAAAIKADGAAFDAAVDKA